MLYNRQRLPLIDVKKVKISKRDAYSFEVEYCLKEIVTSSLLDYRSELKGRKGINLVFVVLTSETEDFLPGLQNIRLRPSALIEIKKENPLYVEEVRISDLSETAEITKIEPNKQSVEKIAVTTSNITINMPQLLKRSSDNISKIHLVSFLQFVDSSSLVPKYLVTKDSDINYELLMQRGASGALEPPSKRRVFYANSIQDQSRMVPYNGPAHYHSEQNPGPGGYIGWMAGHRQGPMGQKLQIKEINNYKIILEDSFEFDKKQKKTEEIPRSFPIGAKGDSVLKHARAIAASSAMETAATTPGKTLQASIASEEKDKRTFFFGMGNQSSHITTVTSSPGSAGYDTNKYGNYYGSVFGIDFASMLRCRSRHRELIDFHFNRGEMNVISEILNRTIISRVEIKRTRISNRPDSKNGKGTLEHTKYSRNQKSKRIVLSSDTESVKMFKRKLRKFRSLDGEIQEVSLAAVSQSGQVFDHPDCKYMRQFFFKDFDLFHNNTEGTYTYSVYVEVTDGMESLLRDRQEKLQQAIMRFEKYSQYLRIDQKGKDYKNKVVSEKKDYTNRKINRKNDSFVNSIASLYFEILNLLEGKVVSKNNRQSMINAISNTNSDLSSVDKFLTSLRRVANLFKERVNQKNKNSNGKFSSSNLTGVIPGNISETFNTGISVQAFNQSRVIAEYIPDLGLLPVIQSPSLGGSLLPLKSKTYSNSYVPTSLLTIKGQQYKAEDPFSYSARKEKKVAELETKSLAHAKDVLRPTQETNLKFKIAVLEQPGAELESLLDKGDLFYSRKVQALGSGIKLKINGRDIASVDHSEVEDSDKSGLSEPNISSAVQGSIFESNRDIEEKDRTLKNLEKEYKNISNIREKLGPIYDSVTVAMKSSEKIISTSSADKIYQNKYSGKSNERQRDMEVPLFDEYSCRAKVVLPGIYEQELRLDQIKLRRDENDSGSPKLVMMKLDPIFQKNSIQANNLFFVEV